MKMTNPRATFGWGLLFGAASWGIVYLTVRGILDLL